MGNTSLPFSFPTISLPSAEPLLSGIFFVALILTVIFSAILIYHWVRYGKHVLHTRVVISIYLVGVLLFLSMMRLGI